MGWLLLAVPAAAGCMGWWLPAVPAAWAGRCGRCRLHGLLAAAGVHLYAENRVWLLQGMWQHSCHGSCPWTDRSGIWSHVLMC